MQQGAKLRRRGRGEGARGGGPGAARRGEGPAHAGGRGIWAPLPGKLRREGGGRARLGPRENDWNRLGFGHAGNGTAARARGKGGHTHHGSNSWMMLSKRMTAKRRELKPASQARKRMVKESNDCHPAGCDKPPDSPAGGPGFGAAAALDALWAPGPWCPWRLFPRAMRPLHGDELRDDLCLFSGAEGSAMLCPGGGSRSSSAAAAAAWSEGCWAETQRRRRRRATATTTRRRRRRRRKSWARSRPQHREAGTLGIEEEAAAAIRSLRLGSGRNRRGLNPEGPCAPLAIRVPRAAEEAAAARADGTRAPEERRLRAAMTFPSSRPPRREEHKGGGAPWSPGGAQDTSDSAPSPNRNWPLRLSQSDRSVKGRGQNDGMHQ